MALRPVFLPISDGIGVEERMLEFNWHPGMAKSQKQKSIRELHAIAAACGISPVLEISSKSEEALGVELSAFNLRITTRVKNSVFTVETAFQGSKVFERGGPYKDLIGLDSHLAKKDIRLKESGNLVRFEFFGKNFPLTPRTYFYDWIYINALHQNNNLAKQVTQYCGFSDIEFNPARSINCQAYSAALYLSLLKGGVLNDAISSPELFLDVTRQQYEEQRRNIVVQSTCV
ncbi:MAG: hypothetical protein Q8R61_04150 [Thiobacillus sp.]|uniref:DarT1-associated NADAR antitoxin family protein n=1 Tax=Thiobacillus sp. TaxID=924 RepID=UPI002736F35C|nr:hypothetical protein [Thiobacillus sp.]MDP3584293.1 hypothetical protein [Thiobacillus sp.]